ncbi:hypothetical protein Ga0123462_0156 [Mariprofundus ferrinatatus]|uniref:Uncharacterized protein n=1 Tax=Mariprofundus ferrinatatus TaxID=1921087 RepID=A0A2K8L7X8_9PROT|nr:hypothetical protein [Mariprofundus ferrinatatus]ATX81034.1 hypothetical protein Ga0123462_0156 [Mariprofundus ferrinatatus]
MSKEHKNSREGKKHAVLTNKEKRAAKKAKKSAQAHSGEPQRIQADRV